MEVKEIITLDDISTYPKKIVEYIENHEIEQFPKLPDDLLEYMENLYCSVYHCTRLEDVEIIKDKGLLVPK